MGTDRPSCLCLSSKAENRSRPWICRLKTCRSKSSTSFLSQHSWRGGERFASWKRHRNRIAGSSLCPILGRSFIIDFPGLVFYPGSPSLYPGHPGSSHSCSPILCICWTWRRFICRSRFRCRWRWRRREGEGSDHEDSQRCRWCRCRLKASSYVSLRPDITYGAEIRHKAMKRKERFGSLPTWSNFQCHLPHCATRKTFVVLRYFDWQKHSFLFLCIRISCH